MFGGWILIVNRCRMTDSKATRNTRVEVLKEGISPILLLLIVLAVTCLVTANIVAVKVISIDGQSLPGGAVIYPLTFLIDDAIVEVYGYKVAGSTIWLGFLSNLIFVLVAELVL